MTTLTLLSARLKLRKRHIREWELLAVNQQNVWGLIKDEVAQKITVAREDKRACVGLKTKQSTRLIKLMERQQQERQQMKARHQQEEAELGQAINAHN